MHAYNTFVAEQTRDIHRGDVSRLRRKIVKIVASLDLEDSFCLVLWFDYVMKA